MQDAVSNNLLLPSAGSKELNLGQNAELARAQLATSEEIVSFEQLIQDQLNPPLAAHFIADGQNRDATRSPLPGKSLPQGNPQTAMFGAPSTTGSMNELGSNLAPIKLSTLLPGTTELVDERVGDRLSQLGGRSGIEQPDVLTPGLTRGVISDVPDSSLGGPGETKSIRPLLQQALQQNTVVNQADNQMSTSVNNAANKVINQSFLELMASETTLNKASAQTSSSQIGVSIKALLGASNNDSGTQADLLRTDSSGLYTSNQVAAKATLSMTLPPATTPAWQQSFGEKVIWMINQNIHSAEVKLNPPEMGRLDIKVSIQQEQTNIQFLSANQQVREIIESALPRLREMLGDSGLNLADVDVSDKSFSAKDSRHQFSENDQGSDPGNETGPLEKPDEDINVQHILHSQDTDRIDLYV